MAAEGSGGALMARHYSKVLVELPDSPDDPPYAVVRIDCDVCGPSEIRLHVLHLGTLLRVLTQTLADLDDDGTAEALSPLLDGTPANKARARDYLDRVFPDWKAHRLRERSSD
jgi:hypothetical protein